MGRWFGFREGYVDLTRIWTTGELAGWFRDLALAEEELRRQVDRYEREHLTPLEFGVKIRAHPDMLVTAENKMGSAHLVSQNYAGSLIQTIVFRLEDLAWLEHNLEATRRFLSGLGDPQEAVDGNFSWSEVDWRSVERYLRDYRGDPRAARVELESIREYLVAQARQDELLRWKVSVRALGLRLHDDEDLGITSHNRVNTISRTRLIAAESSIGSLVNPSARNRPGVGDEEHGLTADQIVAARALAGTGVRYGDALRSQRDKSEALLLVYPISRLSEPVGDHARVRRRLFDDPEHHGCTVIGIALVFPFSDSAATVEYVAGSVAAEEREVAI
jgi:hypothetical protein